MSVFKFIFLFLFTFNVQSSIIAQNITIVDKYEKFEKAYLKNTSKDTIYVFNFWATWCKPCVQELPYFDSLNNYKGAKPIKLILVSLDFENQIESRLKPFLKEQNIQNEVVVLTDGKVNSWINKIDPSWSGAIPATLVLNGNNKLFYEKTFHSYSTLLTSILKIIL